MHEATTKLLADTVTAYRVLVNEGVLDGFGHQFVLHNVADRFGAGAVA